MRMSNSQNKIKKHDGRSESKTSKDFRFKGIEVLIFAILLTLIIFAGTIIIRSAQQKPLLSSGESYYNLRIAHELGKNTFFTQDPLQETIYIPNPYHYFLALLLKIASVEVVSALVPIIMGLASVLLFFRLLLLLGAKYQEAAFALIILAVTPAIITLFTGLYTAAFTVFISLLILSISLKSRKNSYLLSICTLLFLILALTSLTGFVITILALLIIIFSLGKKPRIIIIPVLINVLILILLRLFFNYSLKFKGFQVFEFRNILSVLGAKLGFDIFLLFLFTIGFIIIWQKSEKKRILHLLVLIFVCLSFFNSVARVFSTFILTFYCVTAITYFYKRQWELSIIRTGTLILVLCSLVFSATNEISLIIKSPPDKDMIAALDYLGKLDNGTVLTSEQNSFLVEYYGGKKVMIDPNSRLWSGFELKTNDYETLLMSARLKDAAPLLQKYHLRYILLTSDMKETVWEDREKGIWFLAEHSESFIKKYERAGIEFWEYAPYVPAPAIAEAINASSINISNASNLINSSISNSNISNMSI